MPATTTTCRSCGASIAADVAFCSDCGADQRATEPANATAQVPAQGVAPPEELGGAAEPDLAGVAGRRRSRRVLGVTVALVVVAAVAAGTTLGLRAAGIGTGPSEAEKQAAALKRQQAELKPHLADLMTARASFFAAERKYLPAMKRSKSAIASYQKKYKSVDEETERLRAAYAPQFDECTTYLYVSCPDPDYPSYPSAPDLSDQIADLKAVAKSMTSLHAELIGLQPVAQLAPAYKQLLSAVDALGADAKENARTLKESVVPAGDEDGTGYVDDTKLDALTGNDALPSIKEMNRSLVDVLKAVRLPAVGYDVPGGTDLDPDDDSNTA